MSKNKKLFSDDIEENEENQEIVKNIYSDEVSSNFEFFGKFAVNEEWVKEYNIENRMPYNTYEIDELRKELYKIFKSATFYEKYKDLVRVPKDELLEVFFYFYDRIENIERYLMMTIFIEIAEFMRMNYTLLYKELPMIYKQKLVFEMDRKYHIFNKDSINKLF